jgi:hypothetical protein
VGRARVRLGLERERRRERRRRRVRERRRVSGREGVRLGGVPPPRGCVGVVV